MLMHEIPRFLLFYNVICVGEDTSDRNGSMCAIWAVEMGNMDYLRRDITEDWKKHKGIK